MAAKTFDFTGNMARQLHAEHDAQAAETAIDAEVRQLQGKYPRATVYFDTESREIVIDVSSDGGW
jgi:hypothetical protein